MPSWLSPMWRRRIASWCPIVAFGAAAVASTLEPLSADAGIFSRRHRTVRTYPDFCPPPVFPSDSYIYPAPVEPAPSDPKSPDSKPTDPSKSSSSSNSNDPNAQQTNPPSTQNNANDPNANQQQPQQPDPAMAPQSNNFQAASNAQSAAPNMIGDFFGPTGATISYNGLIYFVNDQVLPGPTASGVGRQKIMENDSPIPTDRVFANYSYFNNVPLIAGGADVNRLTLGFEKTLFDGDTSIEVRAPMASTVDSDSYNGIYPSDNHGEFGNLHIAIKHLLYRDCQVAVSGGLGINLPTADDIRLFAEDGSGVELLRYENHSVHLMPFLALRYTPGNAFFAQTMVQFDFDANGNPIYVFDSNSLNLQRVGRANDSSYAYVGQQIGYWLTQPRVNGGWNRGIAAIGELQWTRSMTSSDVISADTTSGDLLDIIPETTNLNIFNMVLGLNMEIGGSSNLMIGYATPLGGGKDAQFDGELRLIYNLYFGGTRSRMVVNR